MIERRSELVMMGMVVALSAAPLGCSLLIDLDQLHVEAGGTDASPEAALADAVPDRPLSVDVAITPDAIVSTNTPDGAVPDEASPSDGQPMLEDRPALPAVDAAPADEPVPSDAAVTPDYSVAAEAGADASGQGAADAASPVVDGSADADAPMTCPRYPPHSATLYENNGASAETGCGYPRASLPSLIAAVDPATFAASATCGACLRIETQAGVIEAEVVESGPATTAANATSIAVNRAAMTLLVPDGSTFVDKGVQWRFVPCTLAAGVGMTFRLQKGSSTSYAAVLIQNHRFRIASVEYRINGVYRRLTRSSYNYWVADNGMGTGPFTLRITDVHGHVVEQAGIPLAPDVAFRGQAQFPECAKE